MASVIIGRTACPECGFASAHVKKSDKCTYRYCPECGAQHHAKNARQLADLMAKTRLTDPAPTPTPTPSEPAPAPAVEPVAAVPPTPTVPTPRDATPTPPRKRMGHLFSFS